MWYALSMVNIIAPHAPMDATIVLIARRTSPSSWVLSLKILRLALPSGLWLCTLSPPTRRVSLLFSWLPTLRLHRKLLGSSFIRFAPFMHSIMWWACGVLLSAMKCTLVVGKPTSTNPKTQGRSIKVKQPIFGMSMVWKDETVDFETGEVKEKTHTLVNVRKVADARACTLIPIIEKYVAEGSLIITDELSAYNSIDTTKYTHAIVRHGAKEYVIGGNSTNGIEGFWGTSNVWYLVHTTSSLRSIFRDTLTSLYTVSIRRN